MLDDVFAKAAHWPAYGDFGVRSRAQRDQSRRNRGKERARWPAVDDVCDFPFSTSSPSAPTRPRPTRWRRRLRLAQTADRLGYTRYWVAEHHNMPAVAATSPPVLIAYLAAHTSQIRLGSGGVMLPNHAPLAVAEQFALLEAAAPGRIDLGIGRAPGSDPVTSIALRGAGGPRRRRHRAVPAVPRRRRRADERRRRVASRCQRD